MKARNIEQQRHGYAGGHQLLATSVGLDRDDQDVVDRLSDIAGQPGPSEAVPSYLTGYPLPSGRYFAFARTWYDHSAPRAGCVLTHTLLISTADWATLPSLIALSGLHKRFERERAGRKLEPLPLLPTHRLPYPPCPSGGTAELCEAIFLEDRRPILWFTEPSDVAALRLVEALWPALRSKFAFQTYALKPRSKGDAPFDLMLAPRNARSRFSTWEGRRVEGNAEPRHPLTPLLVQSIFETPVPDLEVVDPLGLLRSDEVGDPSRLRLSFLWNELKNSPAEDASELLGMLDVLSAAALPKRERWLRAEPLFREILDRACKRGQGGADILAVALGKLEAREAEQLADAVTRSAGCVTRNAPDAAVQLAGRAWRDATALELVRSSVARELSRMGPDPAWSALRPAPEELATDLVNREPKLLRGLTKASNRTSFDWTWLARLIDGLEMENLRTVRSDLLQSLIADEQAPVLESLLRDLGVDDLVPALQRLHRGGALDNPALTTVLATQRSPPRRQKLQAVLMAHLPASRSENLIIKLAKPDDIDWLLGTELPERRLGKIVEAVLATSDGAQRRSVKLQAKPSFPTLLRMLMLRESGIAVAAQLIAEARPLDQPAFDIILAKVGAGGGPDALRIVRELTERELPLSRTTDLDRLAALLSCPASTQVVPMLAPSVVELLLPDYGRDPERSYSLGLSVAGRVHGSLRRAIIADLVSVSRKALGASVYRLSTDAAESWAELVREAIVAGGQIGHQAAESAITFTLRRDHAALLPLVTASAPTVLNVANRQNNHRAWQIACDICRLYVKHRWPEADFLAMVMETSDKGLVLDAMMECWRGPDYLLRGLDSVGLHMSKKELRKLDFSKWGKPADIVTVGANRSNKDAG
jgi:hypothetical protein